MTKLNSKRTVSPSNLEFLTMKSYFNKRTVIVCVCDGICDNINLFNQLTRMSKKLRHVVNNRLDEKPIKVDVVFGLNIFEVSWKINRWH